MMIHSQVIIVGGGPAGASCAWKLQQSGMEALILDQQKFPRTKLCAGWITPQVIDDLHINIDDYPHSLTRFDELYIHIANKTLKLPGHQYAIRRYEFDHWLQQRSGVAICQHKVKNIRNIGDEYVLDDQYRCCYLVGAGGSHCPVYRAFFRCDQPRLNKLRVVTLEEEFNYNYPDDRCHLWFFRHKLPGYAWYVPKRQGHLNIGIGGYAEKLKARNDTIQKQWQLFIAELQRLALVQNHSFNARGYVYYIRDRISSVQLDHAFLIGDAAGLATRDMGEGIGPAVQSGLLAAEAIRTGKPYSVRTIKKYSFFRFQALAKLFFGSG